MRVLKSFRIDSPGTKHIHISLDDDDDIIIDRGPTICLSHEELPAVIKCLQDMYDQGLDQ